MSERPLVLLSNDDGVNARGLLELRDALAAIADVVVCAPETEQSARSHAITLERPLRLRNPDENVFAVDGTPVDAVYVALHSTRVLPRRPDVVAAGLNHGLNLGNDIFYSGTVAAAREAALRGIPSVAFSASEQADRARACEMSARIVEYMARNARGQQLLNVNFPPGASWPVAPTVPGRREYGDQVDFRSDPRGGQYLWIGGHEIHHAGPDDSDTAVYDRGGVGITAVSLELWARADHSLAVDVAGSL